MRNDDNRDREKGDPVVINIKGSSKMIGSVQRNKNEYIWNFAGGGALVSSFVGEWISQGAHLVHKIGEWAVRLEDGREIILPKHKKWKILFEDGAKIVSLPYKTLIYGQWVLVDWENNPGIALVYLGDSRCGDTYHSYFKTHIKSDISKRTAKRRFKEYNNKKDKDDDYDDEAGIMRALSNGNSDLIGL